MSNIIFLDMDGVLCTNKAHEYEDRKIDPEHGFMSALDPLSVKLLNKLADKFNCKYVLSSTWRKVHDKEWMEQFLKRYGWTGEFHENEWATPVLHNHIRGDEIELWLNSNSHDNYIIFDDNTDMREEQMSNFVKTDCYDGLGIRHYWEAEEILTSND